MEPKWRVREHIKDLSEEVLTKLRLFHVELLIYNQNLSLVEPGKESDLDLLHIYSNIKAAQFIKKDNQTNSSLCLFGSKTGMFAIIYSILYPDNRVLFSEEDERYAVYLRYMISKLGLKNAEVVGGRSDSLKVPDISVFFANNTTNIARTLLFSGKILKKGDSVYIMRGTDWFSELASLPSQICSTWNTEMAHEMDLPENKGVRVIIRAQKTT